ncbi:MAG: cobalamin-dependent protein [Treponema sp.]|jgi:methanogenic corrinoid protein MtbC1|nr:cobalamin-dependent protein [Treponema sp.]
MVELHSIALSVQAGKAQETSALISQAVKEHYPFKDILWKGLVTAIETAYPRFRKRGVLETLLVERALNIGIKTIIPYLRASETSKKGTVVIGTVKGDIQDIEKNLISVMMQGLGLRVIDLGAAVPSERFIQAAAREKAQIIACTAARTTTMPQMKTLVQAAHTAGIRKQVKILVSGDPVTERYCEVIGADLYAPDVIGAAEIAEAHCIHTVRRKG